MHDIDISYADFRRLDLNLMVAFDAMLQERHVGRAAARLFIGQPAMSHALARLRTLLGDELFVRSGKHMVPTALALALGPRVRTWLSEGASFLLKEEGFDPAKADGLVRVSLPDGLETLILPRLMTTLRTHAPGVRLRTQLLEVEQLQRALDEGELDLAIVGVDLPWRNWHRREQLMHGGFHYIYAPEQISLPRSATLAQLARLDHVVSSYRGESASVVDQCFAAQGLERRVVASLASMTAVLHTLRQAPLVSIQPAIYAGLFQLSGLVMRPLRTDPPIEVPIDMAWHTRHDKQALHQYVRHQITDIAAELARPVARAAKTRARAGH